MKNQYSIPPKHLINKKKMLSWQSWREGDKEYFTEIRYFMAPMWIYYSLNKMSRLIQWLKNKLTYKWEAEWRMNDET